MTELPTFIALLEGEYRLWEYRGQPHISRWLTFDLLPSMRWLDAQPGWIIPPRLTQACSLFRRIRLLKT